MRIKPSTHYNDRKETASKNAHPGASLVLQGLRQPLPGRPLRKLLVRFSSEGIDGK